MTRGFAIQNFLDLAPSEILRRAAGELDRFKMSTGMSVHARKHGQRPSFDLISIVVKGAGFTFHEAHIEPDAYTRSSHWDRPSTWAPRADNVEGFLNELNSRPKARRCYLRTMRYLCEATGYGDLEYWNDEVAYDEEDLLDAIEKAIVLAESRDD